VDYLVGGERQQGQGTVELQQAGKKAEHKNRYIADEKPLYAGWKAWRVEDPGETGSTTICHLDFRIATTAADSAASFEFC
jgi:surface antigen